ncbi:hypothetical protein [Coriobacterium glomerans]|uniref:hypothetical protein n=1 Tax=Coriobacterium glomerans TaxID=33871 RepID=UPI00155B0282|nr:hypothetical protein [Coriobacterium glomerans]
MAERYGIPRARVGRRVHLARSGCCCQMRAQRRRDGDADLLEVAGAAFEGSRRRCGCRRARPGSGARAPVALGRRIMRLMTGSGLAGLLGRARRHGSYRGEITAAPGNLVRRDFHAARPDPLWVTDITEFRTPAGKVCLSPVVDRADGLPVCRARGPGPSAEVASASLERACATRRPERGADDPSATGAAAAAGPDGSRSASATASRARCPRGAARPTTPRRRAFSAGSSRTSSAERTSGASHSRAS